MESMRERLEAAKKKNNIKSDAELLKRIYTYLRSRGEIETDVDEKDFIKKMKGSFSQMIEGKRNFDPRFYLPLEKALRVSMYYLFEGAGYVPEKFEPRGLRFAASSDTIANYERLEEEQVTLERDEYNWTLFDYMIEFKSKNGLEYFEKNYGLPLNDIGDYEFSSNCFAPLEQYSTKEFYETVIELLPLESVLKYCNGFHFVEGNKWLQIDDGTYGNLLESSKLIIQRKDLRDALCNLRTIPLSKVNPHGSRIDGSSLGDGYFVNLYLYCMVDYALTVPNVDNEIRLELLERAIDLNEKVMKGILSQDIEESFIVRYGMVSTLGWMLIGSIVNYEGEPCGDCSEEVIVKVNALKEQVQEFGYSILAGKKGFNLDDKIYLAIDDESKTLVEFYSLMARNGVNCLPRFVQDAPNKAHLEFPKLSQKTRIESQSPLEKVLQATEILSTLDRISEKTLGEGHVYALQDLGQESFVMVKSKVDNVCVRAVKEGIPYENLATLLSFTLLFNPTIWLGSEKPQQIAECLTAYGVKKTEAEDAIQGLVKAFTCLSEKYDDSNPNNLNLIFEMKKRALWCSLCTEEIKKYIK